MIRLSCMKFVKIWQMLIRFGEVQLLPVNAVRRFQQIQFAQYIFGADVAMLAHSHMQDHVALFVNRHIVDKRAQIRYAFTPLALSRIISVEHTSELQSRENLVCRLLIEKKKKSYI